MPPTRRVLLQVVLLTVPAVLAGCLAGVPVQPADVATGGATPQLVDLSWSATSEAVTQELSVPAGTGALFVQFELTVDAGGTVVLLADAPDGTTARLGGASGFLGAGTAIGWDILPGTPGTWTLRADADADHAGILNVTLVPTTPPLPSPVAGTGVDRVVVAVVDTGINPYHEVFHRPDLTRGSLPAHVVDAATSTAPVPVPLSFADRHRDAVADDAAVWSQVPARTLVHFEGTNILGYHLDETTLPDLPVLDRAGHGTGVANSVVREAPEALVLLITGNDYDEGVRWAASQPWIDIISLSWGPAVNAAGPAMHAAGFFVTPEATREAAAAGKLVVTASGNDPTLTFSDTTSGPPWVHAVAGSEPGEQGRALMSGNAVDTVANWTQDLARHDSVTDARTMSGTSFATPTTAGIAARILHEVRALTGHEGGLTTEGLMVDAGGVALTNWDLRSAMNATATYWSTADYGGPGDGFPVVPVAPTPWTSMGWGHIDGRAVAPAVAGLVGDAALPEKPGEAEAWMAANLEVRRAFWS